MSKLFTGLLKKGLLYSTFNGPDFVFYVTCRQLSAIMFYLHFWNFLSVIYRWNRNEMFYLLSSSDVAYLDCVDIYKAINFAASTKIECYNVLSPF